MNLQSVAHFRVSRKIIARTETALIEAGRKGYERFVFWSGIIDRDTFQVIADHVPAQTSYKLEDGLCVKVEGAELFKLNRWLYENKQTLGAQIHAHAEHAYHSTTDDDFPVVTILGGLSIVVPHFCSDRLLGSGTVAYRLTPGGWAKQRGPLKGGVLEVTD